MVDKIGELHKKGICRYIGFLKNFVKTLVLESLFNKVAGLRAPTKSFSCHYCKIYQEQLFL